MNYKRRQYFIDPAFQARFILKFCLVVIVASLLIGAFVFLFSRNATTVTIENTHVRVKSATDFILPVLSVTVLSVTIISAIAVLILTLLDSHKISGPMFRLQREVELLKQGSLDRSFMIRNHDQLQALATSLEEMSDTLRSKHVELNNKYHFLQKFLSEKKSVLPEQDKEQLKTLLEELSATLNYFKV
jgi:methyl-accepting chemotaxis protein